MLKVFSGCRAVGLGNFVFLTYLHLEIWSLFSADTDGSLSNIWDAETSVCRGFVLYHELLADQSCTISL